MLPGSNVSAELSELDLFDVVFNRHEELSVSGVLVVGLVAQLLCPLDTLVRPGSGPFLLAPWIHEFNKPDRVTSSIFKCQSSQDGENLVERQAVQVGALAVAGTRVCSARDEASLLDSALHCTPELVDVTVEFIVFDYGRGRFRQDLNTDGVLAQRLFVVASLSQIAAREFLAVVKVGSVLREVMMLLAVALNIYVAWISLSLNDLTTIPHFAFTCGGSRRNVRVLGHLSCV